MFYALDLNYSPCSANCSGSNKVQYFIHKYCVSNYKVSILTSTQTFKETTNIQESKIINIIIKPAEKSSENPRVIQNTPSFVTFLQFVSHGLTGSKDILQSAYSVYNYNNNNNYNALNLKLVCTIT